MTGEIEGRTRKIKSRRKMGIWNGQYSAHKKFHKHSVLAGVACRTAYTSGWADGMPCPTSGRSRRGFLGLTGAPAFQAVWERAREAGHVRGRSAIKMEHGSLAETDLPDSRVTFRGNRAVLKFRGCPYSAASSTNSRLAKIFCIRVSG